MWGAVYSVLVLAVFVRFGAPNEPLRPDPVPGANEPLRLLGLHHGLFYALLLVVCPLEAVLAGGARDGRLAGAVAFASGIALYRWGAVSLGDALSPLIGPNPRGRLVTVGLYRRIRHPMYLGQLLIAVGAPATLGCRWAFAVSFAAAVVLFVRIPIEENALSKMYAEYPIYRSRSKRIVPFIF